jgi:hypothetical protein
MIGKPPTMKKAKSELLDLLDNPQPKYVLLFKLYF